MSPISEGSVDDGVSASPPPSPSPSRGPWRKVPIRFHATASEYFRIWIVNLCLSILTLGIYSAWAKVRTKRYFFGNTEIDGATFEYHATPIMILKGRLVAVVLFALYIAVERFFPSAHWAVFIVLSVILPWIFWRSIIFNARMTSYRNVRFSFIGRLKKYYLILVLIPAVPLAVGVLAGGVLHLMGWGELWPLLGASVGIAFIFVYLLWPYMHYRLLDYQMNHTRYGQALFQTRIDATEIYGIYLSMIGLALLFGLIVPLLVWFLSWFFGIDRLFSALQESGADWVLVVLSLLPVLVFFLVSIFLFRAYMQSRIRNYVFKRTRLHTGIEFFSDLRARTLGMIYAVNIVAIICTLGLAYPWAMVRLNRYKLETVTITTRDDLDSFVTQMHARQNSLAEEVGEMFDMDLDLGF